MGPLSLRSMKAHVPFPRELLLSFLTLSVVYLRLKCETFPFIFLRCHLVQLGSRSRSTDLSQLSPSLGASASSQPSDSSVYIAFLEADEGIGVLGQESCCSLKISWYLVSKIYPFETFFLIFYLEN